MHFKNMSIKVPAPFGPDPQKPKLPPRFPTLINLNKTFVIKNNEINKNE